MSATDKKNWLSTLPVVGYDIKVLLKTGNALSIPWGRLHSDGKIIHAGIILNPAKEDQHPSINQTIQISETDIFEISFKDDKESSIIHRLRRQAEVSQTGWLKDLPKSRNCRIYVMCKNRDDCKEIHKGWISYDSRNIHLAEIISSKKEELEMHDRNLEEVVAILISANGQIPQVFVRMADI